MIFNKCQQMIYIFQRDNKLRSMQMNLTIITKILIIFCLAFIGQSTIRITSPAINPFSDSKIPYVFTNVGTIPYGKTLTFDLKQKPEIDFCLNPKNTSTPLFTQPTYVIVEPAQTSCSFVTQALNAQSLGGKGIMIVSDLANYYDNMIPVDDGNGRKIHISVLMISNETYTKLQTIKNIQIKVLYEVYKSKVVNVNYFLSASGRANYIFLREFEPYYKQISNFINFKPIYLTFPCPHCSQSECLVSTDYCMFEMDTYKDGVGRLILKEQIRQINIHNTFGTQIYLSYMNQFDNLCTVNWLDSQNCGNRILASMKIELPTNQTAPTSIMDQWRKDEVSLGLWSTPQLTINSQIYAGTQDASSVFEAICASLLDPPDACLSGNQVPNMKGNKVGWIIASIIIACFLSLALGLFIYKRCVKKELTKDMFSKVNELVAKYATKVSEHNKKRKQKLKMRLTEEL